MTLFKELVPANFVPAAAVKRGERVLFVITGRKGFVDGFLSLELILVILLLKFFYTEKLRIRKTIGGTFHGEVTFVDMDRDNH